MPDTLDHHLRKRRLLAEAYELKRLYLLRQLGRRYLFEFASTPKRGGENKAATLDEIAHAVSQCRLCPLSKHRIQAAVGTGAHRASLCIVLDFPSSSQEQHASWQAGNIGTLLVSMITESLTLSLDHIYVTYALKCRPRDMHVHPDYLTMCQPYLYRELALIAPKVTVAVGSVAYTALAGDRGSFEADLGIAQPFGEGVLIATHHPAYLLRNPSARKQSQRDWDVVAQLLG